MSGRITNPDILNRKWIQEFRESYYSRIRNNAGELFRFQKDTLMCWKKVAQTKTRPAFQKRAQEFLNLVRRDAYTYQDGEHYAKKLYSTAIRNNKFELISSRGGQTSVPEVVLVSSLPGLYGEYTAGFTVKHAITILSERDIEGMKKTFIHETLHYIDDMSMTPHEGHSCYWNVRLEKLNKILKL